MVEGSEFASEYDVCVVGAGPAGLTLARAIAGAGRRILLLESGGVAPSPDAQTLNDGDVRGEAYAGLQSTRRRGIGGTARAWDVGVAGGPGAKYVPLSPRDLADWPLGWAELEPFYREAQDVCGLGPFAYGANEWTTEARRPFALEGTGLTSAVYQFGRAERFTHTLVDQALVSDSITLAQATVIGFTTDRTSGFVRAVRAVTADGESVEAHARAVVLACGAVENARLLLLEARESGRISPWLGRCFMEHARDFSLVLTPEAPPLLDQASFYDLHAAGPGLWVGGRLTLTEEAMDELGLPNLSLTLVPRARKGLGTKFVEPALRAVGLAPAAPRYGWSEVPSPSRTFDVFHLVMNLEQRPREWNRVELGKRSDRFGNPLPLLTLAWSEEEQAELEGLRALLSRWFQQAGIGRLSTVPGRRPDLNAHHHAGTTRMSGDPKGGVVDPHGRVFGYENLYVTGASVFPRAGFANPTLTIVGLAIRLARHLDRTL